MQQWVHVRKYCADFRDTEADVRQRLADGIWKEGMHARHRDGELFIYIREAKPWIEKQNKRAHVYLISEDGSDKPIKIGVAANVPNRLSSLQIGNHRLLFVRATYVFRSWNMAHKVEKQAHLNFEECGVRGEWFNATAEEIGAWITKRYGHYMVSTTTEDE